MPRRWHAPKRRDSSPTIGSPSESKKRVRSPRTPCPARSAPTPAAPGLFAANAIRAPRVQPAATVRSALPFRRCPRCSGNGSARSEEHTSELQHGYISYAVFCLKKKKKKKKIKIETKNTTLQL